MAPTHSQPRHQKEENVQHTAVAVLPPGKSHYLLYRKLSRPGDRLGLSRKLVATRIRSPNQSSISCRNTDYAILAANQKIHCLNTYSIFIKTVQNVCTFAILCLKTMFEFVSEIICRRTVVVCFKLLFRFQPLTSQEKQFFSDYLHTNRR